MPTPVDNNISGRLCLIVGASGGIGRAVAKDLYPQGVSLALTYLNNEESIRNLVSELDQLWITKCSLPMTCKIANMRPSSPSSLLGSAALPTNSNMMDRLSEPSAPPKISIHQADISSREDIERVMTEIADYHDDLPDILVSAASYHPPDRPNILDELDCVIRTFDIEQVNEEDAVKESFTVDDSSVTKTTPSQSDKLGSNEPDSLDEWKEVMNVNLRANFLLARLCLPHMLSQKWGRLVFITGGEHESIHYQSSKAGLAGFMRHLSNQIISDGITVNSVSPVFINETGMVPLGLSESQVAKFEKQIPAGRLGTPSEVANVVHMFLSTGFLTGQSIVLAGGIRYVG